MSSVFTDTWTPNAGKDYSRNVGYQVAALGIDNFSAYYLYIPDAGRYIAPNTVGVVVTLTRFNGYVTVQAVKGQTAYPVTDTGNLNSPVTISAYEVDPGPNAGTSFNSTIVNAVVISGTVAISGNVGITGPVTVNGSVSISGTPTVNATITNASIAVTGAVNATITNASIAVTGSVSITGTPAVTISGTPTVNVGGTVTANITAGTVSVQNVTNGVLTQAGLLRGLGYQSGGGSPGTTVTYTLTALERAIVVQVGNDDGITPWRIIVIPHTFANSDRVFDEVVPGNSINVVYVNTDLTLQWDVQIIGPTGTSYRCYVSADSNLPVMDIARLGQRTMVNSVPVTIASDQPSIMRGAKQPYDSRGVSAPAVNTQAIINLAATTNKRWIIDYAHWSLRNGTSATAAIVEIDIMDGATVIWEDVIAFGATGNQCVTKSVGPEAAFAGSMGAAMTIRFAGAGGANITEVISYGAYQVAY